MKITEILQVLSDPTRLRMLRLLGQEELSVAELQEILEMGQSRISSHLGLLRRNNLVADRKDGKRTYYILNIASLPLNDFISMAISGESEEEFWESDQSALSRIIERRRRESEQYFDEVAERLGKNYVPGRTWEAIGHFLFRLVPAITIVDLGCRGGNDFPVAGGTGKESNLCRQFQKYGSFGNRPWRKERGWQIWSINWEISKKFP